MNAVGPSRPVLVGIGVRNQREEDHRRALEPLDLMLQATQAAAADAVGSERAAALLRQVQQIAVPKGRWRYRNPGGEIARSIGAERARTVLANVGVLQQTLIGSACQAISEGEIDLAVVTGADAGFRMARARQQGERAAERQQEDEPHVLLQAEEELLHPAELAAGIRMPVALYAMVESAWRASQGWTVEEHRNRLATMLERFSQIAAESPDAWRRKPVDAAQIREPSASNPMQAFPYTRLHCTSWNVDQASALILCSQARAESLGIPSHRCVHALSSSESNHMVAVSAREDLASSGATRVAGSAALELAGLQSGDIDLWDLYSCFPIATSTFAQVLGIPAGRDLTVTGGMPFAGGPFNNYVLQATCRLAARLRQGGGANGVVSSVSGILTKQGFGAWGMQPASTAFQSVDVTGIVRQGTSVRHVLLEHTGAARIAGYTVSYDTEGMRALILADTETGARLLASSTDPALCAAMQRDEFCGREVSVESGVFRLR
jgi:acetyl-CoA C-acetyltransferase